MGELVIVTGPPGAGKSTVAPLVADGFASSVLIPGDWAAARGHALCERNAANLVARLPQTTVFTHLEPREDPASCADQGLDSRPVEAGN